MCGFQCNSPGIIWEGPPPRQAVRLTWTHFKDRPVLSDPLLPLNFRLQNLLRHPSAKKWRAPPCHMPGLALPMLGHATEPLHWIMKHQKRTEEATRRSFHLWYPICLPPPSYGVTALSKAVRSLVPRRAQAAWSPSHPLQLCPTPPAPGNRCRQTGSCLITLAGPSNPDPPQYVPSPTLLSHH